MVEAPAPDDTSQPSSPASPPGHYTVVARRYRPQAFGELIGQEHVARALSNAIRTDRVGHAYLFTGARGVGKTSAARILAKALNCQRGLSTNPCNECDICQSISSGEDVDVLEIDGASNRGIDEIRQLRQNVNVRPSRARLKIYIIDEVHMLTREAFNALLKTLEEPPEHVKFVFCTTEPTKIPVTILSRCQRFDFAGIDGQAIVRRLEQIVEAEAVAADPEALEVLARRAAGSMRDAQSLLEQLLAFAPEKITVGDVHEMLGTAGDEQMLALVGHLVERNAAAALADLDTATAEGVDLTQLLEQLLGYLRDAMVAAAGGPQT
jgi:DNA polymerase-3 subunit gamma/tau